jgi:hypothetical protein
VLLDGKPGLDADELELGRTVPVELALRLRLREVQVVDPPSSRSRLSRPNGRTISSPGPPLAVKSVWRSVAV